MCEKGQHPWNFGLTKETDERVAKNGESISKVLKGRKQREEHKINNSNAHKGKQTFLGKHHTEVTKEKTRGKNHYRYCGGKRISKRKQNYKRKGLGNVFINNYFDNSEGHHLNEKHVLFVPKILHQSLRHNVLSGYNMEEINDLVIKWYYTYE